MVDSMSAGKYSEEFKEQVVREVVEKERVISSVALSYDLFFRAIGSWVAKYRREYASDQRCNRAFDIAKL